MNVMKKVERDILQDPALKEKPFNVPEGYFSYLEQKMMDAVKPQVNSSPARKNYILYTAAAAVIAIVLAVGVLLSGRYFSYDTMEQYADQITEDDIIEYLIYSGVELEEFDQY